MRHYENRSRRQVLGLIGGGGSLLIAGCLADDGTANGTDDSDGGASNDGTESEADTNSEDTDGTDNGGTEPDPSDDERGIDVDEIRLSADTTGWEGLEPPVIAGEMNPTLVLIDGREYTLTWENADGVPHNIEIWDDEEAIVGEYETELMDEEGETQSLSFEATTEMAEYACSIHAGWSKRGTIEVRSPDG